MQYSSVVAGEVGAGGGGTAGVEGWGVGLQLLGNHTHQAPQQAALLKTGRSLSVAAATEPTATVCVCVWKKYGHEYKYKAASGCRCASYVTLKHR